MTTTTAAASRLTKLIVSQSVQLDDVINYMKAREDFTDIDVRYTPGGFQIIFVYRGGDSRLLSFVPNAQNIPLDGNVLSIGYDAGGVEIIRGIAEVFGGAFAESDATDVFTMYNGSFLKGEGFNYYLKSALIGGEMSTNQDAKGLILHIRKQEREQGTKQIRWRHVGESS